MNFFPKTPPFFKYFEELAEINNSASALLLTAKPAHSKLLAISQQVHDFEEQSDELFHHIREEADRTFITPIDREDIYSLGKNLNSIVDYIENVTTSLALFKISGNGKEIVSYSQLIVEANEKISELIRKLSHRDKYLKDMKQLMKEIYELEQAGDLKIRNAYAHLFKKSTTSSSIAWKHIYDNLELILDECEDCADTINDIIIKNY